MTHEFAGLIVPVARELLPGEPNPKLSTATELRYGSHGSLAIDVANDTWFNHETQQGGGVVDLVRAYGSDRPAQWLREHGFLRDEPPPIESQVYDYCDEHGELLFQVVRKSGHKFIQRKPDGAGGWAYKVRDVRQVPYRLPDLLTAPEDALVFVPEGEKDVDNIRALGLVATCNAGGAGKWRPHHAEFLRGRDVVILPDNDEPGRDHAEKVRASLAGIARSVRVLELPGLPHKGDVSDWIAAGGTADALLELLPAPEVPASPLRPVSLADVMQVDCAPWPHIIEPLLPQRVVSLLGGHGGVGKSMLALTFAAHVAAGRPWGPFTVQRAPVVFLSFEDEGEVLRRRLRRIVEVYGLPVEQVIAHLSIFDGSDAETELAIESDNGRLIDFTPMMGLVAEAAAGAGLVIIDNASDTYGANENARAMVRKFIRRLAEIAKANDAAVVLLAHIDKAAARGSGKGNNFSGSTQWHNSVRSRLALVESEESGIELLHEKANYGARAEPLALSRGPFGVLEPVAPEVAAADKASAEAMRAKADSETVLEVLRAALQSGLTITTATAGPQTSWHALGRLPELPATYLSREGRKRLEAALVALERAGEIRREVYKKPNRHDGERWALAQNEQRRAA